MRRIASIVAVVCLGALLAACGGAGETPSPSGGATLRIGLSGDPDLTQVALYKWQDDLKAAGVNVTEQAFNSTTGPFRALVAGEVDLVVAQLPPGVQLKKTGTDLKMIAAGDLASDYVMLSTPDVGQLSDLYGKRVGTAGPGTVSDSLPKTALTGQGIDVSKIEFTQVGDTSARLAALFSGSISAGVAHTAEGLDAAKKGLKILAPLQDLLPTYEFHVMWANADWLAKNRALAQRAVDTFVSSNRWAATDKAGYLALGGQKISGLAPDAMDQAYDLFKKIDLFAVNGGMQADQIASTVDVEQKVGGLPADIPAVDTWTDDTFVEDYLSREGDFNG